MSKLSQGSIGISGPEFEKEFDILFGRNPSAVTRHAREKGNARMRIRKLMLEAERREGVLHAEGEGAIVFQVLKDMSFCLETLGEIDPVTAFHYLEGPNAEHAQWLEEMSKAAEEENPHKPICHEYWDRGLNCECIPKEEQDRLAKGGEVDPGWGPN